MKRIAPSLVLWCVGVKVQANPCDRTEFLDFESRRMYARASLMKLMANFRSGDIDCLADAIRRAAGLLRRSRISASLGWLAAAVLVAGGLEARARLAGDGESEKRVEKRGEPVQTSPSPSGPKPERPAETPPSSKPPEKRDKIPEHREEPVTTTEQTTTVVQQEVVVVEVSRPFEPTPDYLTVPEVLQDTIGRPRVDSVIACADPRYPLPGYAFVGIQARFSPGFGGETVRLQRLDCELEVGSEWHPSHSIFTLVAGTSVFHVALFDENRADTVLVTDTRGGRTHPLSAGISKSGSLARTTRYVLSFQFVAATSGKAPLLQPGDSVLLHVSPSPDAPPTYDMPRFVLVAGVPDSPSTLRLIEKSGALTGVVPAILDLELAAFCSVVRRIPQ